MCFNYNCLPRRRRPNFLSDEIIEIVQGQIKPLKDDKKTLKILTYHHYTYKVVLKGTALFITAITMKSTETG